MDGSTSVFSGHQPQGYLHTNHRVLWTQTSMFSWHQTTVFSGHQQHGSLNANPRVLWSSTTGSLDINHKVLWTSTTGFSGYQPYGSLGINHKVSWELTTGFSGHRESVFRVSPPYHYFINSSGWFPCPSNITTSLLCQQPLHTPPPPFYSPILNSV